MVSLSFLSVLGLEVRVGLYRIEIVCCFEGLKDGLAAVGLEHSWIVLLYP